MDTNKCRRPLYKYHALLYTDMHKLYYINLSSHPIAFWLWRGICSELGNKIKTIFITKWDSPLTTGRIIEEEYNKICNQEDIVLYGESLFKGKLNLM